jgi:hypothetical protein
LNDAARLWADPRLVYTVAAIAVAMLLVTLWLFGRRKRQGRQAAVVCLIVSVVLHVALIFLVPLLPPPHGGSANANPETDQQAGVESVQFSSFDPDADFADASGNDADSQMAPLPVAELTQLLQQPIQNPSGQPSEAEPSETVEPSETAQTIPASLLATQDDSTPDMMAEFETALGSMLEDALAPEQPAPQQSASQPPPSTQPADSSSPVANVAAASPPATPVSPASVRRPADVRAAAANAPSALVPGGLENDFANRVGEAKEMALQQTGGNAQTEAAVAAALRFLADAQRADGAWDPRSSGAGRESGVVMGVRRPGTGSRAESAITGLALLTMMGAGQTHQDGDYADNVYRGLVYLISTQKPNGSFAGDAAPYAANYSHGMAALAMCEAAAITADPSAIESAARATRFTLSQQHPSSGGWRYVPNDPGDLSQLGWQAMVLDAAHRARIPVDPRAVAGVQRFLRSVRGGQTGGLASYRPEERPSRTMTAEALATRLLIGDQVTAAEVAEAERYLLQQPPGVGKDNYYYWYYATLALHQLQDDAWQQWNAALQRRLLATQRSDGGWPADTMWGGYGGMVYTTSMATLCMEAYYRHAIRRDDRIASQPHRQPTTR